MPKENDGVVVCLNHPEQLMDDVGVWGSCKGEVQGGTLLQNPQRSLFVRNFVCPICGYVESYIIKPGEQI